MAGDIYFWLKAGHVIFVVSLMAGLLVYPRYKIHQLSSMPGETLFDTMQHASERLRRIILNPSLILVWIFGLGMVLVDWYRGGNLFQTGWFVSKFLLVLILSGLHVYFIRLGRKIDQQEMHIRPATLRMMNEIPFILMIAIVVLVIVKPF